MSDLNKSASGKQNDIGNDCSATNFVKGVDDDGTLDCAIPGVGGDTDFMNSTGGNFSGPINILSGNLGIGTTSPRAQIEIGNYDGEERIIINKGADNRGILDFNLGANTQWRFIHESNEAFYINSTIANEDFTIAINDAGDNKKFIHIDAAEPFMVFAQDGGNVGIGITEPNQTLHIAGDINNSGDISLGENLTLYNLRSCNLETDAQGEVTCGVDAGEGTAGDITKNISTINLTLVDWFGNWSDVYSNILSINNSVDLKPDGTVTQNLTTLNLTVVDIISNNLTDIYSNILSINNTIDSIIVGDTPGDATKNISTLNLTLVSWLVNWSDVYSNILSINNTIDLKPDGSVTQNITTLNLTVSNVINNNLTSIYSNILSMNQTIDSKTDGSAEANISSKMNVSGGIFTGDVNMTGKLDVKRNINATGRLFLNTSDGGMGWHSENCTGIWKYDDLGVMSGIFSCDGD